MKSRRASEIDEATPLTINADTAHHPTDVFDQIQKTSKPPSDDFVMLKRFSCLRLLLGMFTILFFDSVLMTLSIRAVYEANNNENIPLRISSWFGLIASSILSIGFSGIMINYIFEKEKAFTRQGFQKLSKLGKNNYLNDLCRLKDDEKLQCLLSETQKFQTLAAIKKSHEGATFFTLENISALLNIDTQSIEKRNGSSPPRH